MSLSQQLFDRMAVLKVSGTVLTPATNTIGPQIVPSPLSITFKSKQDDGTPGFRIKFSIQKVQEIIQNHSTIYIYNLGPTSRAAFEQKFNKVELQVGYGSSVETIFIGSILFGRTYKDGPDYVTEIQATDGVLARQNARIDTSFSSPTSVSSVVTTLTGALKGTDVTPGEISGIPPKTYNQGIVLSGSVIDQLKQIGEQFDLMVTVQDGKLIILPKGTARTSPLIVLSSIDNPNGEGNTGLIGIPQKRENGSVSFRSLMNTKLVIAQLVQIISKFVNGNYIVTRAVHSGDTWGDDWFTDCESLVPGQATVL